jgi:MHS family proline/betaine transporter-like MFS transporter
VLSAAGICNQFYKTRESKNMSATVPGANLSLRPSMTRVIVAASIGNMLEWYDFIVYAIFAVPISHAFFPGKSDFTSLLETFITFGVGFLARPLGAIIFGTYADRTGRRAALTLTVLLMAFSTLVIATCPTAATIGIAAPILLVLARLLQGFSAGGEIGGAIALLIEYAPPSRKAFYSTFQEVGQGGALLLCGLVATIVTTCFSKSQMNEWAWRIPFLFGLVIAPVGLYIRRHVPESEDFIAHKPEAARSLPIRSIFSEHRKALLIGIGLVVAGTVGSYVTLYIPTYASTVLKLPQSNAHIGLILVGIIVMMLSPAAGILADRLGQKSVMLFALVCLIVYPYPAFRYLTSHPSGGALIAVQAVMALFLTIYAGPAFGFLAELFPTTVRSTGIGLAYGLSVAILGGFTPTIVSALVHSSGNQLAVAFWLMASAVMSAISLVAARDRSQQNDRIT